MFILLQPLLLLILKNILLLIIDHLHPFPLHITPCPHQTYYLLPFPPPLHQNHAIHHQIPKPQPPPHILIFLKIFAHIRPTKNHKLYNHMLTQTMKRRCQSFPNRNQLTKETKQTPIQSAPPRSTIILTNMEQSQVCLPIIRTTSSRNPHVLSAPKCPALATTNQNLTTNHSDITPTCFVLTIPLSLQKTTTTSSQTLPN